MSRMVVTFCIFCFPALVWTLRHNMHMLQLNGYQNIVHLSWLKKNIRRQWLLIEAPVMGMVAAVANHLVTDILCLLNLLLIVKVYQAIHRLNTKKKLVFTARVKRMIGSITLIYGVVIWAFAYFVGEVYWIPFLMVLVSAQLFMGVVANVLNAPIEKGVRQYYINDARKKLDSAPNLTVIGVTGSYGKTSVKFYLKTLLQARYSVLATPESYNTPMGVVKTIRESLKPSHEIFVCEMGAYRLGEIKEICDIVKPEHGVITAIGPQHLDTFLNIENIKTTKFELADALPKEGMLFLNGDNEYIQEKSVAYENRIFYYSEGSGAGYMAKDIAVSQLGTDFTVVAPNGDTERFQMKLIGMHNVINVMGAVAVAHKLGIELKDLKIPMRRIVPVEHRMEMREHGDVTIIDDAYNSNPIGSKAAVETLAMFEGIKILITPGMVDLGKDEEEYNYKFGTYAADCCDYILLVGRKHTEPILRGALRKGFPVERCLVYDKLEEALNYAYSIRGEGHKYILLENDLPDNY